MFDLVVAVDRKAVSCGSCRRVASLRCQVDFLRWGGVGGHHSQVASASAQLST